MAVITSILSVATFFTNPLHSRTCSAKPESYNSVNKVTNQRVISLIFVGHYRERWHSHFASANIIAGHIVCSKEFDDVTCYTSYASNEDECFATC